jgi:hypothetical protein
MPFEQRSYGTANKIKNYLRLEHIIPYYRPMSEEEEGPYISRVFLKTLDEFLAESDAIFNEWGAILAKYKQDKDVMGDLGEFRARRTRIFVLIDDIYHKEVDLTDKLDAAGVGQDIRDKISEFKDRFAELADEVDMFVLTEIGAASTRIGGM